MNDETDPTTPLPTTPVSATPVPGTPRPAAAESGPAQPVDAVPVARTVAPDTTPFHRRHSAGIAIAGAALAVVLLAGGTAWGVSAAVAASQSSVPMSSTSQAHAAAAKKDAGHAKKRAGHAAKAHGVRGTIAAIDGSTWRVHSAAGATVTVRITSTTAFGTAAKPAARSSFAVGDRIAVLGTRTGDTVTAKRVVMPSAAHATPTPGPTV